MRSTDHDQAEADGSRQLIEGDHQVWKSKARAERSQEYATPRPAMAFEGTPREVGSGQHCRRPGLRSTHRVRWHSTSLGVPTVIAPLFASMVRSGKMEQTEWISSLGGTKPCIAWTSSKRASPIQHRCRRRSRCRRRPRRPRDGISRARLEAW